MNLPLVLLNRRRRGGLDAYREGGFNPALVFDFDDEYYRTGGSTSTFSDAITYSRTSNATMVDSDGLLKWGPHNLALNSATPATQSITVISGAQYTVECTGVSIALSGAGTGTVTEGNPVTITASTTTLTLTVTGSTGTMWAYRSDLGGMVDNPDRGDSYVPTTSSARYLPRRGHHVYNGTAWVNDGLLHESEARTNLLLNSGTLATQNVTVTAVPHTLHFTGTGTVTLLGASTDGPLVGTGTGENNRVSLTFTPTAGTLTLTVFGTVTNAQLEAASTPSSYIPTSGATVTRAADTLTVPSANLPWPTVNVIGSELVTNGTFDTDVSGWSAASDGRNSVTWASGKLRITNITASQGYAYQTVSTVVGRLYKIEWTPSNVSTLYATRVYWGNAEGTTSGGGASPAAVLSGPQTITFVATTTTTYVSVQLFTATAGAAYDFDNISVREIDPLAVSIQMQGRATGNTYTTTRWYLDANNYITQEINSSDFTFEQAASGTVDAVTGGSFTSGVNTPFNFASTHASTLVAAAVGGTALTDNTTPVALPNLSATDLNLGHSFMGTLKLMRVWSANITEAGREEATT